MFATPLAFLWLLPVLPILVILYFVNQETKVFEVPSILHMLALPDSPVPVKQRLRYFLNSPFFWLQLLLIFLLVAALAKPIRDREVRHSVYVIDVTASMQATEEDSQKSGWKKRLSIAIEAARERILDAPSEERIAIIEAGRSLVTHPFTPDKNELMRVLSEIRQTDTASSASESVFAAANMLLPAGGGRIVLLTDSQVSLPASLLKEGLKLEIVSVGTLRPNAAIVALDTPSSLLDPGGKLIARVRSFSPEAMSAKLAVSIDDKEIANSNVALGPMGLKAATFDLGEHSGIARVSLILEDALALDNTGYAALPPRRPLMLLLISARKEIKNFLEKLDSFDLVHVQPDEQPDPMLMPDIVIVEGVTDTFSIHADTIYLTPEFDSESSQMIPDAAGELRSWISDEIYYWEEGHPLIDQVALDNLRPEKIPFLKFGKGVQTVIGGSRAPFVGVYQGGDRKHAICALPIRQMLNNPTAVLLLMRLLEWCNPRGRADANVVETGSAITLSPPDEAKGIRIVNPTGAVKELVLSGGPVVIEETDSAGLYRVEGDGYQEFFIARVSPGESDLSQPAQSTEIVSGEEGKVRGTVKSSFSPWLLIILPCLMLLEWWMFFRRRI